MGVKKTSSFTSRLYRHFMHDSMRRNSSLLIISQAVAAVCAFLFWVINARLFSAGLVGLATAFISYGMLIATFTTLGLPNTIIRFLPSSKHRGGLFTASLLLVSVVSLIGGVFAVILARHLVPKLAFVHSSVLLSAILILLIYGTATTVLLDGTLMAFRKGEYILHKSMITNVPRIVLPFFVVTAGLKGITAVVAITLLMGIVYNLYIVFRKLLFSERLKPTLTELTRHRPYAASNYFDGMFGVLPVMLVPIIVLNALGAEAAAYFYMPMMITVFLSVVCNSISQALISECSQTENYEQHKIFFKQALKHQYQLLFPIVLLLIVAGWPILSAYGTSYAKNGFLPLIILLGSSLIVGINWLGDTWLNIQKRSRDYFLMNAFNAITVVGFVFLFAPHGLVAASLGWLCGQLLSAIVYLAIFARSQLLYFAFGFKINS